MSNTTTPINLQTNTAAGPDTGPSLQLGEAGLETVLVFENGFELPEFAAFPLLDQAEGRAALESYYRGMIDVADANDIDLVLDTPTWRASKNWGDKLGYDETELNRINAAGVAILESIRSGRTQSQPKVSISGSVGPAADAYRANERMTVDAALEYHGPQMRSLARAGAEIATVQTMTYVDEALGATLAARSAGLPVIISFTLETDGALPSGRTPRRRHPHHRRRDRYVPDVLWHQLRTPGPLQLPVHTGRGLARSDRAHPGQRLTKEPRRARQLTGARSR